MTERNATYLIAVWVTFGCYECDESPDDISRALELGADGSVTMGEPKGNSWWIDTDLIPNDVNELLRDLLEVLKGKEAKIKRQWNPQFSITWQGEDLAPTEGYVLEADVLKGIARCKASLSIEVRKRKVRPA